MINFIAGFGTVILFCSFLYLAGFYFTKGQNEANKNK